MLLFQHQASSWAGKKRLPVDRTGSIACWLSGHIEDAAVMKDEAMNKQKHIPFPILALCTMVISMIFIISCNKKGTILPTNQQVHIGTHTLHIYCVGEGNPTVVIDTGITETYESWIPLIDSLRADTRICAYDRAGYGKSEPGPLPRDSQRVSQELYLLLKNAGVAGPYVLVGHSLGGLNMQVFADQYPHQTAGAILLDPPPLDWLMGKGFPELRELFAEQTRQLSLAAEAARSATDPEAKKQAGFLEMVASESSELMGQSAVQASAIQSFGDLPLTVIASTEPNPNFGSSAEAYQQFWIDQSENLATKSTRGKFILAEGSSHHIHLDKPQLVLDAIREMVTQVREYKK
jgi:pimeloyl-ACP methyl ester carboxylesterase